MSLLKNPWTWIIGGLAVAAVVKSKGGGGQTFGMPPIHVSIETMQADWEKAIGSGSVPIFEGMPTNISRPPGFELVPVWVTDSKGTYPDPRRFVQFHQAVDSGEQARINFQKTFYLGVIEGGSLTFYAIGKPVQAGSCCEEVKCTLTDQWQDAQGWHETQEEMSTALGGTPAGWKQKLGPAWVCECAKPASACYTLVPRPPIDWPEAQTGPNPKTYTTIKATP